MNIKNSIASLDYDVAELKTKFEEYRKNFETILIAFKREHNLDGAVNRRNGDKIERGELSIITTDRYGYNGNITIPCYFIFKPYLKNGGLSNVRRTDKFYAGTPSKYFEEILKIYAPDENT